MCSSFPTIHWCWTRHRASAFAFPLILFSAVVPYPFAKTKAITHQLVNASADRPEGWSSAYAKLVQDVVLPGHTVFSVDDARTAAERLLSSGPIRIKEPLAAGGAGHTIATTFDEVEAFPEAFPDAAFIAGEMSGRMCYGVELDPAYVDVVVQRWQRFTGRDAVHQASGQSFDERASSEDGDRGASKND